MRSRKGVESVMIDITTKYDGPASVMPIRSTTWHIQPSFDSWGAVLSYKACTSIILHVCCFSRGRKRHYQGVQQSTV